MRNNIIGLGQCGSFIVYDVIADIFDSNDSYDLRSTHVAQARKDLAKVIGKFTNNPAKLIEQVIGYFVGQKVSQMPRFYVIDGNTNNRILEQLNPALLKRFEELQIHVNSLPLSTRNSGCSLGQIGEYYFEKEREDANKCVFNQISNQGVQNSTDMNIAIFSSAGGSGSGGIPILNSALFTQKNPLINMVVAPSITTNSNRARWNSGRCFYRLAQTQKQTALLLFSNLSESLEDQYALNKYIRELNIRFSNFGYPGNVPKIGTDFDTMDFKSFLVNKPAFVGMSSIDFNKAKKITNKTANRWVKQALSVRTGDKDVEGLSIEIPDEFNSALWEHVSKAVVVIGIPHQFVAEKHSPNVSLVEHVKEELSIRLDRPKSDIDIEFFSYGSLNKLELTLFFRHNRYRDNFIMNEFLSYYLKWYENEPNEYDYLSKTVTGRDIFLEDAFTTIVNELAGGDKEKLRNILTNIMGDIR